MRRTLLSMLTGILALVGCLWIEVAVVSFFDPALESVDPSGPLFAVLFSFSYLILAAPLAVLIVFPILNYYRLTQCNSLGRYLLAGLLPGILLAAFLTYRRDAPHSLQLYRSLAGLIAAQVSLICYWIMRPRGIVEGGAGVEQEAERSLA